MPNTLIINTLLLLISFIFCSLLFSFSIKERQLFLRRSLVVLLAILAVWYLSLALEQLARLATYPSLPKGLMPIFGLARPGLMLIFAGLAHNYIAAVRERGILLNRWFNIPLLYGYAVLTSVITRFSLTDKLNLPLISAIMPLLGLVWPFIAIAYCYNLLPTQQLGETTKRQLAWPISFATSVLMILAAFFHTLTNNQAPSIYNIYALISILPLVFWLIYYHTPYLFFDALVKRGTQMLLFTTLFGSYYGLLAYLMKDLATTPFFYILITFVASLPISLLPRLQTLVDRSVDIYLLGRVPLEDRLLEITKNLSISTSSEMAINLVCGHLSRTLDQVVVYQPTNIPANQQPAENLIIPINIENQSFGSLYIAKATPRRYLSEEIKLCHLIAHSLATTLARLKLQQVQHEQQLRELALINTAQQLRLKALQAQLDPHFLFNSMNLIGTLVRIAPEKARTAVHDLSRIYRYVLDSSRRDLVNVGEEIEFLKAYLEIEQMRFEERLRVKFNLTGNLEQLSIPPMLLQPLVENAIKHGISPQIEGGELTITIVAEETGWRFTIADTGAGFDPKQPPKGNGVGLTNVQQQLLIRYNINLEITTALGAGTQVTFVLPRQSCSQNLAEGSIPCAS